MNALKDSLNELKTVNILRTPGALKCLGCKCFEIFNFYCIRWEIQQIEYYCDKSQQTRMYIFFSLYTYISIYVYIVYLTYIGRSNSTWLIGHVMFTLHTWRYHLNVFTPLRKAVRKALRLPLNIYKSLWPPVISWFITPKTIGFKAKMVLILGDLGAFPCWETWCFCDLNHTAMVFHASEDRCAAVRVDGISTTSSQRWSHSEHLADISKSSLTYLGYLKDVLYMFRWIDG